VASADSGSHHRWFSARKHGSKRINNPPVVVDDSA